MKSKNISPITQSNLNHSSGEGSVGTWIETSLVRDQILFRSKITPTCPTLQVFGARNKNSRMVTQPDERQFSHLHLPKGLFPYTPGVSGHVDEGGVKMSKSDKARIRILRVPRKGKR
jgi:hypothetical protein